jgi:four helix bundle protein
MQNYRELHVWAKAHELTLEVRKVSGRFPDSGYASLKSQLVRAAESVPINIAEGCGAATRREFARFLDISIKSSSELQYELRLARDYELLSRDGWGELDKEIVSVRRMLCKLRARVLGN